MSIGMADVQTGVIAAWNSSGLNETFRNLWVDDAGDSIELAMEFPVISDQEAPTGQPFPYCVLDQGTSFTQSRDSGVSLINQEIRDVGLVFNIHARSIADDSRTPKEIAAFLAEEVMGVFGGHPVTPPTEITLANGRYIITQYQTDFGIYTGEDEFQWVVDYLFRVDIPVAI